MTTALLHVPTSAAAYDAAIEGLTRLDETIIGAGAVPPLYKAGVRYKTEPREVWRHAADVAAEGWGDCEDLSAYRAAELRVSGEDPDARVRTFQTGPRRYHAVVERGNGILEDPSRVLGMGIPRGKEHLYGEDGTMSAPTMMGANAWIGADPQPGEQELTFQLMPVPGGGWRGLVRVPLATGNALFAASSKKPEQQQAVQSAMSLATQALNSPAAQALLPPPAKLALNVLKSPEARAIATNALKVAGKLKFW